MHASASPAAAAPPSAPSGRRSLLAWGLALGVPLVLYLALAARLDFLCDDGFISFRYAKNLVLGHGLRFNLAAHPPVEGYTNLAWTLCMAAVLKLGGAPEVAARVLSLLCGAALLLATGAVARRRLGLGPLALGATLAFLATSPSTAVWATGGLETMAFALAVFLVYERLLGDPARAHAVGASLAAGAAALLRSDGMLFAGAVLAVALLVALRERRRDLARGALATGIVLALVVGANLLWRHATYGAWLPETAHIKAGLTPMRVHRGLLYLATYALTIPAALLVPLAAAALARGRGRALALEAGALLLFPALYATYTGGDFLPFGRFLMPAVPFLALLLAVVLARLAAAGAKGGVALAGAAAVALSVPAAFDVDLTPRAWRTACHFRWTSSDYKTEHEIWLEEKRNTRHWMRDGKALARFTDEHESIVLAAIGAVGYYSCLQVFDIYGLVSPEVASLPTVRATPGHDRVADQIFFLRRRPTYVYYSVGRADGPLRSGDPRLAGFVDVERHALTAADGAAGLELRLFRLNDAGRRFLAEHASGAGG